MCVPPKTSSEWNRRQGGGGADLCVRSAGYSSEITRTAGPPNHLDRESRCASLRRHHPNGTGDRVAGGLSGVSDACVRLPIGTVSLRSKPSGADTEVRPPATRWLAPGHGGLWVRAQRGLGCMRFGCPSERFLSDPNPAERTQRSAPPRPAGWPLAMLVFGGGSSGFFDSGVWVAQWDGCPPIQTQRSGHRGPPPRDPLCGPWPRGALGAGAVVSRMHAVWLSIGTVALRCKPSGADTEVRPPATRCAVPGHGGLWGWVQPTCRSICASSSR